jgi:lysophospholipase L1-like esterase
LHGFLLEQGHSLAKAPAKQRHIELVGDSITTGFGNLAHGPECRREAALEDVEQAYGAVAARELGAAYTAIAWSGKGVLRNNDRSERQTMPELYERALPAEQAPARGDVARADAVVINLGTNDLCSGVTDGARFVAAYRRLVARVRARHPDAWLVLVTSPMIADAFPRPGARTALRAWLSEVRDGLRSAGDERVDLLEFTLDPREGVGCDRHPNRVTHARLGRELADLLRARLSW